MSQNLLDLIPPFRRQLRQYVRASDTDSILAGYLADAIDALNWRWSRSYVITFTPPHSYTVDPDITVKDRRPVILMASIIYKMGATNLASFRDGDFAYNPVNASVDPFTYELDELKSLLPTGVVLASGFTSPLRGFNNMWNRESYDFLRHLMLY